MMAALICSAVVLCHSLWPSGPRQNPSHPQNNISPRSHISSCRSDLQCQVVPGSGQPQWWKAHRAATLLCQMMTLVIFWDWGLVVLLILVDPQMVPFDDPTLKVAATHVPSIVAHPFHDIESILKNPRQPCDESLVDTLWEVYSVPRLQPIMNKLGGRCRRSFDLKSFWDFREPYCQKDLLLDLASLQPLAVMLSPPCTYVCQLMHSNWQRMDPKKRVINLQDACGHIDFSMWIATYQYQNDRYFGFEHPGGSLAWDRDSVS